MIDVFIGIGFFFGLFIFLLLPVNMISYYGGYYTKGGRDGYLKRHYSLLAVGAFIVVALGLTIDYFHPPSQDSSKCTKMQINDCLKAK